MDSITLTNFLDPRFKNLGFLNEGIASEVKTSVDQLITSKIMQTYEKQQSQQQLRQSQPVDEENSDV